MENPFEILKDFFFVLCHYFSTEWESLLYQSWVILGAIYIVLALTWGLLIIYDEYKEKKEEKNG